MTNYLATQGSVQGSIVVTLLYVVIIGVFMYFVMIRPQKKQADAKKIMLSELKEGDSVMTTAGFYGVVIAIIEDDTVIVEFGNDKHCRIPMQKEAIVEVEKQDA